ncbi:monovalent cation/H+ antiporter complex subunit F [Arenibaculum pallidiluteum]|uniref:monovalent cation/H+ antiporter complex subunit F n=1 Tax=Arenibaculum pallidiluteum TaxID=2812559 RepID=UPI001A9640C7|nr:monovalent cation/H+ antiporter complex subunit F [Arenibaculum pallidiluteum]
MSLVTGAAALGSFIVSLGLLVVAWRVLRGPSTADRAIATDMLGLLGIAAGALTAILSGSTAFLDVALGVAVFGFLGAVALAGLMERGSVSHEEAEQ